MIEKYPLMNEYWEDKRGKAHLIEVPTYVLASMSTLLHTEGSTRCYEEIPHDKKWYVFHPQSCELSLTCSQAQIARNTGMA